MLGLSLLMVAIVPASAGLYLIARMLGVIAPGAGAAPAFLLINGIAIAVLMMAGMKDQFIDEPEYLQSLYLGHIYAGAFDLRGYRNDEWQYALSPQALTALRPRCKQHGTMPIAEHCDLYYRAEDRSFAHAWIEGGRLHLTAQGEPDE